MPPPPSKRDARSPPAPRHRHAQPGLDRVEHRHLGMKPRAQRHAARRHHDRLRSLAQGIGGGIDAEAAVMVERGDRRVGEQFQIVMRQPARAGGSPPFPWPASPMPMPDPASPAAPTAPGTTCRPYGASAPPAPAPPASVMPRDHRVQHRRQPAARPSSGRCLRPEGRADADHHLCRVPPNGRRPKPR